MLVLTRKLMERLFIGDDICVTVVRLEGGQVRLGIEAPREVPVVRAELLPGRQGPGPARNGQPHDRGPESRLGPNAADPTAVRPDAAVRTPPGAVHGNGIRRRGPSR